jgi:predicted naringenin-chalcone synthase
MYKPIFIAGIRAQLPRYCRPQQEALQWLAEAHARAATTAAGNEGVLSKWQERMAALVRRYSCTPEYIGWRRSEIADYMHTDWPRMTIFKLNENPRGSGLDARNRFYDETANRAVEALFAPDVDPPSDLIHVSCTGYVSPSPIQRLIALKRWTGRTEATQVYHMGCYAALPALRIAAGLLSNGNTRHRADIVHTELCTLHFNPGDHSAEQLVVQSLFADGHIRYSLVHGGDRQGKDTLGVFEVLKLREEMVPDSLDDMTWVLSEWGFRMTLSREVPEKIASFLPRFLAALYASAGMNYSEMASETTFAVHPGGPRILDSVEDLLGLEKRQLRLSRDVLFHRGNMSSATLPHIWLAAGSDAGVKPGALLVSLAFGPGLTVAGALFRKC